MLSDAIRAYLRTLRRCRKMRQNELAERIGIATRTYKAWESGEIVDIKSQHFLSALRSLNASAEQIAGFTDDTTVEEAQQAAQDWAAQTNSFSSDEQVERFETFLQMVADGVEPRRAALKTLK